jgi:hypothetical protein
MQRTKSRVFSHLILFIILLIFLSNGKNSDAGEFNCEGNVFIEIIAPDDSMHGYICTAVGKAIEFLAQYDLHPKRLIKIEIVEGAIDSNGYVAFGSYDRLMDIIQLMSYDAITSNNQSPQMYDQPFDVEHYQGAIAHEITHAVFQHNSRNIEDQLTNATQEYLAHSTQLGALTSERRRKIIDANDVGAWESGDSISDIYMGLNPTGFAVKSYLHLTQLEDPQPFIKLLLNNNWFYVSVP